MPNRNYETGRRLEYLVMKVLRENLPKNCNIYRTAGRHTEADVIVIQKRRAVTIQCKARGVRK
mgnify:CR=1 FL=1